MEVLAGQSQRNMLVFLSARTCLFSRYHLPLRKVSSCRTARFHGSHWNANSENAALTLSNVGFGNKSEVFSSKKSKTENWTSYTRTPSKTDTSVKLQKHVGTGDKEVKVLKDDITSTIFRDKDSFRRLSISKEKTVKPSSKENGSKRVLNIDTSVFSAKSFSELSLSPLLIKRMDEVGITAPTEVQSTAIPTIHGNHDVVIQSYTGSGKTFAYLLPILSELGPFKNPLGEESENKHGIEAVIVAPSRELGMQIVREAEKLLGPLGKKFVQQLVGGANRSRQEEALKKNKPAIVIGTPGRIAEISASGRLHTHSCRFLVLDEVDQLLSFNFREDMHRILEHVGRRAGAQPNNSSGVQARRVERQLIMVSATVPFSVIRAARNWGTDPVLVKAKNVTPLESSLSAPSTNSTASDSSGSSAPSALTQAALDSLPPGLHHFYCISKAQHKVDTLRRCIHALDAKSVIVFMNYTKQLKDVVFKLEARGIKSAALHGDLGKLGRSTTLKNFKNGEVRVLVTNELSARGLDVFDCDLVVNLDLPTDSVHYAHRAGRTGRLGQMGNVVTIVEEPEVFVVNKLQRQLGVPMEECEFTDGKLILHKKEEEKCSVENGMP